MSTSDRYCCIGWCGFDKNSLVLTFLSCLLRAVYLPDKILLTISDQCLWKSATEVQLKVKDGLPWQGQLLGGWWHGDFLQLVRIQIQIQIQYRGKHEYKACTHAHGWAPILSLIGENYI